MTLRRLLRALVGLEEKPERTALAYSIGVFVGFSPLLGLHTVLGVILAFFLRLNRMAVLLGVYTNAPWWMVPFYGFAGWFGYKLMGMPSGAEVPEISWSSVVHLTFWEQLAGQWQLLVPVFVGSFVLSTALALIAYPVSLRLVRSYRRVKANGKGRIAAKVIEGPKREERVKA